MDFQEERQLAKAFFMEVSSQFLAHVPPDLWTLTNPKDHVWHYEVNQKKIDQHPYRFLIQFDQRNRVVTFSLLHQHGKSIRVFPHLYYRLIAFLEDQEIDCIVRNEDDCLREVLYNKKNVRFHSTGDMSGQIVLLLQQVLDSVEQGMFYWWNEGQTVHFATPHVNPFLWNTQFIYDESKKTVNGRLEINGVTVANAHDIVLVFAEVKNKIKQISYIEQTVIGCISELDPKSYYDPLSRSMIIFEKRVPFKAYLATEGVNTSKFNYAVKFGEYEVIVDEVGLLNEQMRQICTKYVKTVRLQAAVEGRA